MLKRPGGRKLMICLLEIISIGFFEISYCSRYYLKDRLASHQSVSQWGGGVRLRAVLWFGGPIAGELRTRTVGGWVKDRNPWNAVLRLWAELLFLRRPAFCRSTTCAIKPKDRTNSLEREIFPSPTMTHRSSSSNECCCCCSCCSYIHLKFESNIAVRRVFEI